MTKADKQAKTVDQDQHTDQDSVIDEVRDADLKQADQTAPEPPSNEEIVEGIRSLNDQDLLAMQQDAADRQRYVELAQRTQADFDNYQKRVERQRRDEARYAISPFVREVLTSLDNLERAIVAADETPEFEPLYRGVAMTFQLLEQSLGKFGVKPIQPTGEEFNPEFHEALMTSSDPEAEDNFVLECLEKGWMLHDRVIRPAKVRVNKKAP